MSVRCRHSTVVGRVSLERMIVARSNDKNRSDGKGQWQHEDDASDAPTSPVVNFDGSIRLADLGGGLSLGSDGHLHLAGIDLMGS